MSTAPYPTIRLKPKSDARAVRFGAPWIYADELVLDRRTKALAPGSLAVLQDGGREDLGLVGFTPNSQIAARILDRDSNAQLNTAWFETKIAGALAHRALIFNAPFYRLIHAEADGLPGVLVDRFGECMVVQPNAAWAEAHLSLIVEALVSVTGATTVIKNASGRTRKLEGLDETREVLRGSLPDATLRVPMNGAVYLADLTDGQKTGLFFDQRPNHAFAARLSKGARVLDVFSHVGGFGLAALAADAEHVTCVDGSASALSLAQESAKIMGRSKSFTPQRGDAFEVLTVLGEEGAEFDVVVCDPPAIAPRKPALEKGLRAYERIAKLAAPLVSEGGYLVLCSCSHAADVTKFSRACARGIGRAGRRVQLVHTGQAGPDHPQLMQLSESGYLKARFFRVLS